MAFLRIALSLARRHYATPATQPIPFHFLRSPRFLSSASATDAAATDSSPPPPSPTRKATPVLVQPVSYAVKTKLHSDPSKPQAYESIPSTNLEDARSTWTKEDARYLKDAAMSSVASQVRVAPLPEDKAATEEKDGNEEELDNESNDGRNRVFRKISFKADEELERVPFPTLIKVEKKPPKPVYDLDEAIKLMKENAKKKTKKFVETVEAHARLGVNQRRTDLAVSGMTTLPHGTGKVVKVAVFAQGTDADEAKDAGAYIVGGVDLVEGILNGTVKIDEFDTCIATPQMIPQIQKLARVLGKHGLFPNAKKGTIVSDVAKAVEEAKRGRINFKMDKSSIVHVGLGKVNFSEDKLKENIAVFANALLLAKPAGLKKTSKYAGYLNSFHLCSTMGPGYAISIDSLAKAADQVSRLHVK